MSSDMRTDFAIEQSPKREADFPVLLAGMATTALTLLVVYFVNKTGFHPMGFLLWFVVPAGAIVVGTLSGLGYYVAQRRLNLRVSRIMLFQIAAIAVVAYFTAHYLTYRSILAELPEEQAAGASFLDYMRYICENVSITSAERDSEPMELGKLGYAVILLEMVGFGLGALIPSLILRASSYCEGCQQYLKKHDSYIVASKLVDGFKKLKKREKTEVLEKLLQEMIEDVEKMSESMSRTSRANIVATLERTRVSKDKKATATVRLDLLACPKCDRYHANVYLDHSTVSGENASSKIKEIDGPGPGPAGGGPEGEAGGGPAGEGRAGA